MLDFKTFEPSPAENPDCSLSEDFIKPNCLKKAIKGKYSPKGTK